MDLVRLVLERCERAADGVDLIARLLREVGQGGSGHPGVHRPYWSSFLLADPREGFVVETSGNDMAVEAVTGTRATSNRTTIPAFDAVHRHPRQPVEVLVDPRLRASQAVLARQPVTVAALQAHLASHAGGDDGWTVCMHVDGPEHREATTAAMVAELPARRRSDGAPPRRVAVHGRLAGLPLLRIVLTLAYGLRGRRERQIEHDAGAPER